MAGVVLLFLNIFFQNHSKTKKKTSCLFISFLFQNHFQDNDVVFIYFIFLFQNHFHAASCLFIYFILFSRTISTQRRCVYLFLFFSRTISRIRHRNYRPWLTPVACPCGSLLHLQVTFWIFVYITDVLHEKNDKR